MDEQLGVVAAVLLELVDEAEIVEDLLGAWLDALAAGAVERFGRLLDDPERDAAALQLAGQGEAGGSGADIMAEAGRATGSFYQHFTSKEKLLEALLADLLAEGDAAIELSGHGEDFADRDAVRWHVAAFWGFYRRHRTVMDALQQAAIVDQEFGRVTRAMLEPDLRHIADHLAGLDLPGDPLIFASMFTALLQAFATTWLSGPRPALGRELSDDEAIEALTSFAYGGFTARRRD